MTTLLERLRLHQTEMTARERQIASYLEAGYPHAGLESATAVSERVNVSAATVVRFVAKLGYNGYADLQRELREETGARLASPLQRLDDQRTDDPDDQARSSNSVDVVTRSFEAALASLSRSYGSFDRQALASIDTLLTECKGRVWIIGEKKARSIALYLYAHLNLCLDHVSLLNTDASFEADQLLEVARDDVVIVIDVRRYVERGVVAAEWCLARGASLVVLSDSSASPLFAKTNYRLAAFTNAAAAFDSYVSLMFMVDVLTNAVTLRDPDRARKRLSLGEAAWSQFQIFGSGGASKD